MVFTVFGAGGQAFVNRVGEWKANKPEGEGTGFLSSKWSPLRKMSDEEYENFMSEKMLKVEAEIALIDDKIAELQEEERAKQAAVDQPKVPPPQDTQTDVEKQAAPQELGKPKTGSWWRWP